MILVQIEQGLKIKYANFVLKKRTVKLKPFGRNKKVFFGDAFK